MKDIFGKKMEGRWALSQQSGQKKQGVGAYGVNVAGAGWAAAAAAFLALIFLQEGLKNSKWQLIVEISTSLILFSLFFLLLLFFPLPCPFSCTF